MFNKRKFTPPEVAKMWGVTHKKILEWIHAGELPAIDAVSVRNGRPRFLIDAEDLRRFEQGRLFVPTTEVASHD